MKKILLVLTLISTLLSVSPKSQAGLVVGSLAGDPGKGALIGFAVGATVSVIAATELAISGSEAAYGLMFLMFVGAPITLGTTILPVEASHLSVLDQYLNQKFSFIDNQAAITNLSTVIRNKHEAIVKVQPEVDGSYVTLTKVEVEEALGGADLTTKQLEIVANQLK